jgi:hypothetical protein
MGEFDKYLQEIGIEQSAISAFQSQRTGQVCHGLKATQDM